MKQISLPDVDFTRGPGELPKATAAPTSLGRLYEFHIIWRDGRDVKGELMDRRPLTPALCRFVSEGKTILPKRHIPTLKAASPIIASIVRNIMANSYSTIAPELKAANVERQKLLQEGRIDEAARFPIVSEDELYSRKQIASNEFKKALRQRQDALLPIWAEVAANLGEAALEKHAALEAEEKTRLESLGLTYRPTELIIAIGQLTWRTSDLLPSGPTGQSSQLPEDTLKKIGIEI